MIKLNQQTMIKFELYLQDRECSQATIKKYLHDIMLLNAFCNGEIQDKAKLISFKSHLQSVGYTAKSVNSMLAAVNCFLTYVGHTDWKLRFLKIQRSTFSSKDREMGQTDYQKLVRAAKAQGDERMFMLLQTICATGIRVSEVRAITVESLSIGRAEITSKGKIRLILIPKKLCKVLLLYCNKRNIKHGCIFITKSGRPLDRSNIWKMMKRLAALAKVAVKKVFPHNLRHLFAQTYYKKYKDIVRLADILGHSSIDTTRIYTLKNGTEQQNQIEQLSLLLS